MFGRRKQYEPEDTALPQVFLSHCSNDVAIMNQVTATDQWVFANRFRIFCTYQKGISAGKERGEEIRRALAESECMIAFITDSYMRSVICMAELSAMWAKGGRILPVIYNGADGAAFLHKLFGEDVIYIDASRSNAGETLAEDLADMFSIPQKLADMAKPWVSAVQGDPDHPAFGESRPYIGSNGAYDRMIGYCNSAGIRRMTGETVSGALLSEKLHGMKGIYVVGTVCGSLISDHVHTFAKLCADGADLHVLTVQPDSPVLKDEAALRVIPHYGEEERELERLRQDALLTDDALSMVRGLEIKNAADFAKMGTVSRADAFTLIRQNMIVGLDGDRFWAWVTFQSQTRHAADSVLSMEIETDLSADAESSRLAQTIRTQVQNMWMVAVRRGAWTKVGS